MDFQVIHEALEKLSTQAPQDTLFWRHMKAWLKNQATDQFNPEELLASDGLEAGEFLPNIFLLRLRETFIQEFGYAVPQPDLIQNIAASGPILEIGAGLGTFSRLLRNIGCDVIATDANPDFMTKDGGRAWTYIEKMEASAAVSLYCDRTVLYSWPSYQGTWLTRAAKKMKSGQALIVIGEGEGGCTASDCFFDLLHADFQPAAEILNDADVWPFPAIHDRAEAYRRN